jgi:hypothetical protein
LKQKILKTQLEKTVKNDTILKNPNIHKEPANQSASGWVRGKGEIDSTVAIFH